jgi:hypothetical protein
LNLVAGVGFEKISVPAARLRRLPGALLGSNPEHDPEKWAPVFGKDHAQTKNPPQKIKKGPAKGPFLIWLRG